jgi:hypothetical protein
MLDIPKIFPIVISACGLFVTLSGIGNGNKTLELWNLADVRLVGI